MAATLAHPLVFAVPNASGCDAALLASSATSLKFHASPALPCSALSGGYLFCDDFSEGYISKWKHEIAATGGGNAEFQMYTQHPQNSFIEDGSLHLRPTLTHNTMGDLRGNLDLHALGCTSDWNNGCHNQGTLHAEASNPGGKLWASQVMTPEQLPELRQKIAAAGLPPCEEKDGVCNHMVPVGGLRQKPVMSAKLTSRFSFKYGRVEIVATLPRGDYLWPALWMLPTGGGPWPTGGEIDIMESMGNGVESSFDLDHSSTAAAVHFGQNVSWYELAYTPTYERLLGEPFGTVAGRRQLSPGPHTFGCYWARDNMYVYVDDDANRVLDMDQVFKRAAQKVLSEPMAVGVDARGAQQASARRELAAEVAEQGYAAGWRKYSLMSGKAVPDWLWREGGDAPFNKPYHLIMNLAVGGNFFGSNGGLNPGDKGVALFDVPIVESGQLPSMYWYSRMKKWWKSWAKGGGDDALPPAFAQARTDPTAFLETRNTWSAYANGGQDAGRDDKHKADQLANETPPPDEAIGEHVDFQIHRVVVYPVEGSKVH